jgi:hypothetical protein
LSAGAFKFYAMATAGFVRSAGTTSSLAASRLNVRVFFSVFLDLFGRASLRVDVSAPADAVSPASRLEFFEVDGLLVFFLKVFVAAVFAPAYLHVHFLVHAPFFNITRT